MSDTHAQAAQLAFVRTEEIPAAPPPIAEAGLVKWLRENLFSTIGNTILTLVSLWAIWWVLSATLPLIFNGVWNANSLQECREILDGATGACWAVIRERWEQLLFGVTYPSNGYWRPTLAFVLLFVALAPVLFPKAPRTMLPFTAVYPFLAYFLIWGGAIWVPLMAAGGFVVGYLVFQRLVTQSFAMGFFGAIGAALVFWWLSGFVTPTLTALAPITLEAVPSRDMGGFMLNLILGTVCVSL
ncbi:MAG: amino acid ABC transporter permease, partial [Rhodosalinus sp.]